MSLMYSYASCQTTCLNDKHKTKAISCANVRTCDETKRKSFLVAVCARTRQTLMLLSHRRFTHPWFRVKNNATVFFSSLSSLSFVAAGIFVKIDVIIYTHKWWASTINRLQENKTGYLLTNELLSSIFIKINMIMFCM